MKNLPSRGYIIERIFFSTCDGVIETSTIDELLYKEIPHVSAFYKGSGFSYVK